MRSSIIALSTVLIAGILSAGAASAQSTPLADQRQKNQANRIYNGVQNGSLTRRETGGLIRGQARVQRIEGRIKRDGVVTGRERLRLQGAQNRQSRRIFRRKNN